MFNEGKLNQIIIFLEGIGIPVVLKTLPDDVFLPGIRIEYGGLAIDKSKLLYLGDVLHEAGHIACMAPSMRRETYADAGENLGEEIATHAWSFAAGLVCDIPPEVVFHENGYRGNGNWLCELYKAGGTNGVPLLQWFDLTEMPKDGVVNPNEFPKMKGWLRAMDDPTAYWEAIMT